VIHVGDLSFDGAHDVEDLRHARRQLDRLPVPWHAVPGNHDVGDNPWPGAPDGSTVDNDRNRRWLDVVGADHWSLQLDGWRLLAINAQLLGSGLPGETRQWTWLQAQLDEGADAKGTVMISHKPLTASDGELDAAPPYRFVPQPARDRLMALMRGRNVALVVSGHVHQYRRLVVDGVRHLWAPTTWAVLPDEVQPTLGTKRCGVVTLDLTDHSALDPEMVEPDGLSQFMLAPDIPAQYRL
jgi:3',5'-cyclic-AMP phosphodiesterase